MFAANARRLVLGELSPPKHRLGLLLKKLQLYEQQNHPGNG
jgi:hypothetical protein